MKYVPIHSVIYKHTWLLGIIGLDTAHIGWLFGHEDLHQFHQAIFKLCGCLNDRKKHETVGNYLLVCVLVCDRERKRGREKQDSHMFLYHNSHSY